MRQLAYQWLTLTLTTSLSIYGLLYTRNTQLSTYILLWSFFHANEYLTTYYYSPRTVTPYSFLMYGARGSIHLAAVHLASILEHIITMRLWNGHGSMWGTPLAIGGIFIRMAAIATCGNSFSHYIETGARSGENHPNQLITHGIYSWCRHPSYIGFLVYVVGMQVILGNFLLSLLSLIVLGRFFVQRMDVEEWILVNQMYGQEYVEYQKRVKRMIPGVY